MALQHHLLCTHGRDTVGGCQLRTRPGGIARARASTAPAQVRAFYDQDYDGVGKFNLDYYKPFKDYPKHVIAARITAENPDEAFTPTSREFGRCSGYSREFWAVFRLF